MSICTKIRPLVLVGCSGSGRSAIIYNLIHNLPHKFERLISHTTRIPRKHEINNKHFYFIDQKWIKQNEQKFVTLTYSGNKNYYGLTKQQVNRVINNNKIPIFKMTLDAYCKNVTKQNNLLLNLNTSTSTNKSNKEVNEKRPATEKYGHLTKDKKIECHALYIKVPSMEQLQRRLKFTPFTPEEQVQKIQKAKKQQNEAQKYFNPEDIIEPNNNDPYDDLQETIMKVKSRLFDLY